MTSSAFSLSCLSIRGDGVLLQLSVMPNAKRTEVDGLHDGALRVRLAALSEDDLVQYKWPNAPISSIHECYVHNADE